MNTFAKQRRDFSLIR